MLNKFKNGVFVLKKMQKLLPDKEFSVKNRNFVELPL